MSDLNDIFSRFIDKKSDFLDLPDGAEKTVTFNSVEPVTSDFKGQKVDCLRYYFEIDGKVFKWDRTSRELAKQMSKFTKGDMLKIKREGERNKTKYTIQKVNE